MLSGQTIIHPLKDGADRGGERRQHPVPQPGRRGRTWHAALRHTGRIEQKEKKLNKS